VPRFYLHVRRGQDYALDREGYEFPTVEVARNEALRAALKAWHRLPAGQDPAAYAIEVEHESGVMVLSVPFAEAFTMDRAMGTAGLRLGGSGSPS
jgi:hypothetical protein